MSSAIRVALRVRPEIGSDAALDGGKQSSVTIANGSTVTLHRHKENGISDVSHQYTFDKVFEANSTQEEVYSNVRDLIEESLRGYNVTIFAFGMTGSGKTHTIAGDHSSPSSAGIVPRAVHQVFSDLRAQATRVKESVAMVFLTFVELYNNTFYDLLASEMPSDYNSSHSHGQGQGHGQGGVQSSPGGNFNGGSNGSGGGLKLHEHPVLGMQLSGSSTLRLPVASAEEALALIERGYKLRATSATNLNERSSRSHTVLSLEIVCRTVGSDSSSGSDNGNCTGKDKDKGVPSLTRFGKINLVDLAGSERVKLSGAEGQVLEEAKQINKALSVLGDVLNSLSKRSKAAADAAAGAGTGASNTSKEAKAHIPYRNSKLTMLLKDSLGGNAKTMMIATIRLSSLFYQQTLTSLQYAARARHIRCNPVQNLSLGDADSSSDPAMQKTLLEMSKLKTRLDERTREFDELKKRLEQLESERSNRNNNNTTFGTPTKHGGFTGGARIQSAVQGLDPNDPDYAAKFAAATAAENKLVEDYKKQIDALQVRSTMERSELQEKMRFVIHSHEGTLAAREKQYMGLEMQLQQVQSKAEGLNREKDNAIFSKKEVERQNKELYEETRRQRAELQRLTAQLHECSKELTIAQDRAAQATMSNADREQFVEALQRLTISRGKHKSAAAEQERKVSSLKRAASKNQEQYDLLAAQVADLTARLVEKNNEISELAAKKMALQLLNAEQERLMAQAVKRIRFLENGVSPRTARRNAERGDGDADDSIGSESSAGADLGPTTPTRKKKEVVDNNDVASAAMATAIVIASTEASAAEISLLKQQLHLKTEELEVMQATATQSTQRETVTAESYEKELTALTTQIRELEQQVFTHAASEKESRSSVAVVVASLQELKEHHVQEILHLRKEHVSALLVQETHATESIKAAETTANELREQVRLAQVEARDMERIHSLLRDESVGWQSQLQASKESESTLQFKIKFLQEQANALSVEEGEGAEQDPQSEQQQEEEEEKEEEEKEQQEQAASPGNESRHLRQAISQMQEHELGIFNTLEAKLRDLDDARIRLRKLKSISADTAAKERMRRLASSPVPYQPFSHGASAFAVSSPDGANDNGWIRCEVHEQVQVANDNLREALRASQKKADTRYQELLLIQQANTELTIRLESARNAVQAEQRNAHAHMQRMHVMREEHFQEIERMTALVRNRVNAQQVRRREYEHDPEHDLEHDLVIERSEETDEYEDDEDDDAEYDEDDKEGDGYFGEGYADEPDWANEHEDDHVKSNNNV